VKEVLTDLRQIGEGILNLWSKRLRINNKFPKDMDQSCLRNCVFLFYFKRGMSTGINVE
jgi:hypothetical protein